MQDSVQQRGRVQSAPHLRLLTWEGSDAELLELIAMRDDSAASRFHDRFASRVHALVRVLLGPDPAQARLVECSLLRAFSGLYARPVNAGKLPSWVESHVVQVVRGYLRRRRLAARLGLASVRFERDASEDALLFYERLTSVPTEARIAFCLRYVAGRALSDTALLCGCSLSLVRERLISAERLLQPVAEQDYSHDHPELGWES